MYSPTLGSKLFERQAAAGPSLQEHDRAVAGLMLQRLTPEKVAKLIDALKAADAAMAKCQRELAAIVQRLCPSSSMGGSVTVAAVAAASEHRLQALGAAATNHRRVTAVRGEPRARHGTRQRRCRSAGARWAGPLRMLARPLGLPDCDVWVAQHEQRPAVVA